jgi:hypothetical protein
VLSRNFTQKQVKRLSGLKHFPKKPEAVLELIKALQSAPTEIAAQDFVDRWVEDDTESPRPKDILSYFYPNQGFKAPPSTGCSICGGTGWRVIERGNISSVAVCSCRSAAQTMES